MRMHSVGKCNPNLIAGASLIFTIFVVFNYWNLSTLNQDLKLRVHTLEKQLVSISSVNEALQSNLDKTLGELKKEKTLETKKESSIKTLENDLEIAKQDVTNFRDELTNNENRLKGKDKEILKLKEKSVKLEAQLAEKNNLVEKARKELGIANEKLKELMNAARSSSSSKAPPLNSQNQLDDQPVLMNDPAVPLPHPHGWMDPSLTAHRVENLKNKVQVEKIGWRGFSQKGPHVILFDNPNSPRVKPRFSVADPPRDKALLKSIDMMMNPEAQNNPPEPLKQPNHGGDGDGVLPLPNQNHNQNNERNLDAAEEDGDPHVKDDHDQFADDQSPDGNLNPANNPVGPPPPQANHNYPNLNNNHLDNINPVLNQPPADDREAAHFANARG